MNPNLNAEQQIARLRAEIETAQQQISQLQNASHRSIPSPNSSDLCTHELYSPHSRDFKLSAAASVNKNVLPTSAIPRSISTGVHNRHDGDVISSRENGPRAVKRLRTQSQQVCSSQKMERVASNSSVKSAGPFKGSMVSLPPKMQTPSLQPQHSNSKTFPNHDALPSSHASSNMIQHVPSMANHYCQQQDPMAYAVATGPLLDVHEWLAQNPPVEVNSPELGTPSFPGTQFCRENDSSQFNMNVSVCDSMTSAPTCDDGPMTRQNSQFEYPYDGVRMVHMNSQMSLGQDAYIEASQQSLEFGDSSFVTKQTSRENTLLAVGSNLSPPAAHEYATVPSNDLLLASTEMERTISSTSTASAKSTSSSLSVRAKEALKQQNQRALNAPIMPKPSIEHNTTEPAVDQKRIGKEAITKAKYVRPKQPKVFCHQCDEHKDGFRGEHELRRHRDAKHQVTVKKFICVHPHDQGLPVNVSIVNPLDKCKACQSQKRYGAYYNAAAHLRRTHFKEKPSRSKNKTSGSNTGDDEKRGGKGGGDWPSMHELKNWMKEITVRKDERQSNDDDADEDVDNIQHPFGSPDAEGNFDTSLSSDFSPNGMNLNYPFANDMIISTEMFMNTIAPPISSADFAFPHQPSLPNSFNAEVAVYPSISPVSQFGSAVSSSATVTQMPAFDVQQHRFGEMNYPYQ
ncbi:hypothetical protein GGR57DRAFT_363011 [Xylariaceae sp. FL1272]|nr:hypothetical protein GGR57DRAFT_363011 [Xylariaceae sp. FL1272]